MDVGTILICIVGLFLLYRGYKFFTTPDKQLVMNQAVESLQNEHGSDYAFSFVNEDTAIYLFNDLKRIGFINSTATRVYPIDKIRGHNASLIQPDHVYGGGTDFKSTMQTLGAINTANKRAKEASGLYVQMRDIEFPEWRIKMFGKDDQNRWHEILTQLYEGKLSS